VPVQRKKAASPADDDDEGETRAAAEAVEVNEVNVLGMGEDLNEKLKILNFESGFLAEFDVRGYHVGYFAYPTTNPNEQFNTFSMLACWLVRQTGKSLDMPSQYDDPNAVCATLLVEARNCGVSSAIVKIPPSKLRTGSGEAVLGLLHGLADICLRNARFAFLQVHYQPDGYLEDAEVEEDAEVTAPRGDDLPDDDMEEQYYNVDGGGGGKRDREVLPMESHVDPAAWKLELERVAPSLKVSLGADQKEWRAHLELMETNLKTIESTVAETLSQMERLGGDVKSNTEKIATREKHINSQFSHLVHNYRAQQEQLASLQEQYKQLVDGVGEKTQYLQECSSELETVKEQMDSRGNTMTDTGPLQRIKVAIHQVKHEIKQMDLRIGVVEQTLMNNKWRLE
jgi:intraflagellar transport protein 57